MTEAQETEFANFNRLDEKSAALGKELPVILLRKDEEKKKEQKERNIEAAKRVVRLTLRGSVMLAVGTFAAGNGADVPAIVLATATAAAAIETIPRLELGKGVKMMANDAVGAVVEGGRVVGDTITEVAKKAPGATLRAVGRGADTVLGGAGVVASRVSPAGRENLHRLHEARHEAKTLTVERYKNVVLREFDEMKAEYTKKKRQQKVLADICVEEGGGDVAIVEAVVVDRVNRIRKEREDGEDNVSLWLKLRRLKTLGLSRLKTLGFRGVAKLAFDQLDRAAYSTVFAIPKRRVDAKIQETERRVNNLKSQYTDRRINYRGELVERSTNRVSRETLGDLDRMTQEMSNELAGDMADYEEVMVDYILEKRGYHKNTPGRDEEERRLQSQVNLRVDVMVAEERKKEEMLKKNAADRAALEELERKTKEAIEKRNWIDFIKNRAEMTVGMARKESTGALHRFIKNTVIPRVILRNYDKGVFELFDNSRKEATKSALFQRLLGLINSEPEEAMEFLRNEILDLDTDRRDKESIEREMADYLATKNDQNRTGRRRDRR